MRTAVLVAVAISLGLVLSQDGTPVFRADTRLVVLHATVAGKSGKPVPNVPATAFRVFEDGLEQHIKAVRREDIPVSMGIVIDNSGSMLEKRRRVESAAIAMVRASNPQDEVTIFNFSDLIYHDVLFTNDIRRLEEGVARGDSNGSTYLRDATDRAIDYVVTAGKHDRKLMVIITDGNDNSGSPVTLEKLVQKAQQHELAIYAIGLLGKMPRRDARRAKRALEVLAKASGGRTYYPGNADEIRRFALELAQDIRDQYMIAYSPLKQELDGSYRQIRVTVHSGNGAVVRTRTGYYAAPAGPPKS